MANVVNSFNLNSDVLHVHFVEESSTPWIWDSSEMVYITNPKVIVRHLADALTTAIVDDVHKARQLISAIHTCRNHI